MFNNVKWRWLGGRHIVVALVVERRLRPKLLVRCRALSFVAEFDLVVPPHNESMHEVGLFIGSNKLKRTEPNRERAS